MNSGQLTPKKLSRRPGPKSKQFYTQKCMILTLAMLLTLLTDIKYIHTHIMQSLLTSDSQDYCMGAKSSNIFTCPKRILGNSRNKLLMFINRKLKENKCCRQEEVKTKRVRSRPTGGQRLVSVNSSKRKSKRKSKKKKKKTKKRQSSRGRKKSRKRKKKKRSKKN